MKTLIPMLGLSCLLVGCASESGAMRSNDHHIGVHQKKAVSGTDFIHEWKLSNLDKMAPGQNKVAWHRKDQDSNGVAKKFSIVVALSPNVTWDDSQSVNKLHDPVNCPFTDKTKYQMIDSTPVNNEQVVSLQATPTATTAPTAQYFVLIPTLEEGGMTNLQIPYDYYMIDALLDWQ
jgi:hypothetical protein